AWVKGPASGAAGFRAAPLSPPRSSAARESRRRPAICFLGPWQEWQWSARIGRTRRSKSSAPSGETAAGSAARARPPSKVHPRMASDNLIATVSERLSDGSKAGRQAGRLRGVDNRQLYPVPPLRQ